MKKKSKYSLDDQLLSNLGAFQSIDNAEDWQKVKQRIGFKSGRQATVVPGGRKTRWYWPAAAMVIILLGVGFLGRNVLIQPHAMLVASSGETKKEVLLPDGSVIHLNKNSELEYPEKFARKSRNVSLRGEGFFEVARNPEKPFEINISGVATVEVLGTSFNIKAYPEGDSVKVNVLEGRVAFFSSGPHVAKTILVENDQALLKNGNISKELTEGQNFLSWKTGILRFDQEPLSNVMADLANYYHRKFILDDPGAEDARFSSVIDNQELESVLEEIRIVLGLAYKMEGDQVVLYRNQ